MGKQIIVIDLQNLIDIIDGSELFDTYNDCKRLYGILEGLQQYTVDENMLTTK